MTIAISLKVNDGVVLAADSATTLFAKSIDGKDLGVANIYNNANKVFNLRKGLPIGAITWGSGSIGPASISTLMKDLRARFSSDSGKHAEWYVDASNYTVESVAGRVRQFFFDEMYKPAFKDWPTKPPLGLIIAGYSADAAMAEEYMIAINGATCDGPTPLRTKLECGMTWNGEPEAVSRLVLGVSPQIQQVLHKHLGVPDQDTPRVTQVIQQHLQSQLVMPAMPIQDAIDLAVFLVDTTVQFSRFSPGPPTVGGPIEVATITKHEGFKWVQRKYYFQRALNPPLSTEEE